MLFWLPSDVSVSSVFPQEIQPGDHHQALLGRKVSVHACLWCSGYLPSRLHIKNYAFSCRVCDMGSNIMQNPEVQRLGGHTQKWQHGPGLPPPFLYQKRGWQTRCQYAGSDVCFSCHAELFCSQPALVTFLKVFRLKTKGRRTSASTSTYVLWVSTDRSIWS